MNSLHNNNNRIQDIRITKDSKSHFIIIKIIFKKKVFLNFLRRIIYIYITIKVKKHVFNYYYKFQKNLLK